MGLDEAEYMKRVELEAENLNLYSEKTIEQKIVAMHDWTRANPPPEVLALVEAIKKELSMLKLTCDALRFYGDEKTWKEAAGWVNDDGYPYESCVENSKAVDDFGIRARSTLANIEDK